MKKINEEAAKIKIKNTKRPLLPRKLAFKFSWFHLQTAPVTLSRNTKEGMKYLGARAQTRQISITKQGESL
jgi:hypothetical protein